MRESHIMQGCRFSALLRSVVALCVLAVSGCQRLPFGYVALADLVHAPGEYEGKTVKTRGEVKDVVKLPLPDLRYYVLKDGDAEIVVFAATTVPAIGAHISVVGRVSSPAIIGGTAIGLHLTEQEHW
jgi:hypothetical protein